MFLLNNNDEQLPSGQPGYGHLCKICPVINALITKFQNVYRPEKLLTIHEPI
jgi:hypothetical protein